jgi:hypothetical protein
MTLEQNKYYQWVKATEELWEPGEYVVIRVIDDDGTRSQRGSWECRWDKFRKIICFYDLDGKLDDFIPESFLYQYEILQEVEIKWPTDEEIEQAAKDHTFNAYSRDDIPDFPTRNEAAYGIMGWKAAIEWLKSQIKTL